MGSKAKGKLTFILGGSRSGKSAYAMAVGDERPAPRHFLPTAEPFDEHMIRRIADQRASRGTAWLTHETGGDLVGTLNRIPKNETVLIDCLSLWLTRLILDNVRPITGAIDELVKQLKARGGERIVVSSEVGLGIVPDIDIARGFRDHAGELNQKLAQIADTMVLVVAGVPMTIK